MKQEHRDFVSFLQTRVGLTPAAAMVFTEQLSRLSRKHQQQCRELHHLGGDDCGIEKKIEDTELRIRQVFNAFEITHAEPVFYYDPRGFTAAIQLKESVSLWPIPQGFKIPSPSL